MNQPVHLSRQLASEVVGTALLTAVVAGSGIMAQRLSSQNEALALLANTVATGAGLVALILVFGPVSGAHFNPAVSLVATLRGQLKPGHLPLWVLAQCAGALAGLAVAHVMFGLPPWQMGHKTLPGAGPLVGELVATFALLSVVLGVGPRGPQQAAVAVGAVITAGYWFTSSTSFANPAVTLARCFTPTFTGISPAQGALYVPCQLAGALLAWVFFAWLLKPAREIPAHD